MAAQNTNPDNSSLSARAQQQAQKHAYLAKRQFSMFQQYRADNPGRFDPYVNAAAKGATKGVNKLNQAIQSDPDLAKEWANHGIDAFNTVSSTVWKGGPNGLFTGTPEFGPASVRPSRVPLSDAPQFSKFKLAGSGQEDDAEDDKKTSRDDHPDVPDWIPGNRNPWDTLTGGGGGNQPPGPPTAPPTGPDGEDPGPPSVGPFDDWPPATPDPGPRTVGPFDDWQPPASGGGAQPTPAYPSVDPVSGRVTTPDPGVPRANLTFGPSGGPAPTPAALKPGDVPTVDPLTGKVSLPPAAPKKREPYGGRRPYDPQRPRPQGGGQQIDNLLAPMTPEEQEATKASGQMLSDLNRPADGRPPYRRSVPPKNYRRPKTD